MALVKYNDRSLRNLTTAPAAAASSPGALQHIKTLTASSSGTLSFVDGSDSVVLDNTYPIYKFEFTSMHPATNGGGFEFQTSTNSGSSYGVTQTSTATETYHSEDDGTAVLNYATSQDKTQSTDFQRLVAGVGSDNDQSCSGTLMLFNPSSTTFVKHWMSDFHEAFHADYATHSMFSGYFNTTSAIDAIQFKFANGNMDAGTIKLYGIKDS